MTAMSQQPCKRSSPNSDRCFESGARTRDAHLRSLDDTAQADERAGSGAQYGPEPKLGDAAVNAPDQDPPPVLRLLVRAKRDVGPNAKTLQISGVTWAIAEYADVGAANVAPFSCVSYSWGPGRTRNPFGGGRATSDRTVPVIEAAVASIKPDAMWIDAISVPDAEPARSRCLRSMGAIYGEAKNVIVVLSSPISEALEALAGGDAVDEGVLLALEADDWVSRAWTYQELVNSAECWFITENGAGPVAANPFLDAVGFALSKYKRMHGLDAFGLRQLLPRLDALESLIADRERALFLDRSAYQVISAMEGRSAVDPDDKYYAMIGALTQDVPTENDDLTVSPAEYLMRVCERKGDFSFIYAIGPRGVDGVPTWRPSTTSLWAVFPWFSDGERQSGELHGSVLRLHKVHRTSPGRLTDDGRSFLESARQALGLDDQATLDGEAIVASLRRGGFKGQGRPVELPHGYYLPLSPLDDLDGLDVIVSTEIRWPFGAPALLVTTGSGPARVVDVGVVLGPVPHSGTSINLR
jgi:hypothetical protein